MTPNPFIKQYLTRSHAFDIDTARKRVHQKLEAELYELPPGYHSRYIRQPEITAAEFVRELFVVET